MKKELKEYIKNIKMDDKNIKLKNTASIISIIVEAIKVLLMFIFINSFSKNTVIFISLYAILTILFSIFIVLNDDYKKIYKYIILDLSTLVFFLSNIIGGILIEKIIWNADKKILKKIVKQEKKTDPLPIKLTHQKKVYLYLFLSIIIGYSYITLNPYIFYILVYLSLIFFFIDDIKICLKDYKKNYKEYVLYTLRNYVFTILISTTLFIIVGLIVKENATNEVLLNERPLETFILGVFYAPIVEELLFRGCLRKLIKNDTLFILISGISFGLWHVVGYDQSILQYLYAVPYSVIGMGLAYIYTKSNNIFTSVSAHALNNLIASLPL